MNGAGKGCLGLLVEGLRILSLILRQAIGYVEISVNVRKEKVLVREWHFARFK